MRTWVEYSGLTYQVTPSISGQDEHCSSDLMVQNGFNRPRHFRAGAWQQGPKLQAALVAHGCYWDSSRIDARLLTTHWPSDSPLIKGLQQLHAGSTTLEQPYALSYPLMEYPDNAALADYTNTQQLLRLFDTLLNQAPAVMVLGFHQESAADYLLPLERAITHIQRLAKQKNVTLMWMP